MAHEAKAPTCTEIGWNAYDTCSRCDYTTYAELPALGHDWSDWAQTKAPTCTEAGEETRACGRCDQTQTRTVEALGHDLMAHEAKAPTCTEIGWNAYDTCSRCDYTTYEELPALEHSFENGVCVRCGEKDPDYVPPVNKTALEEAVSDAEKVDTARYTDASAAALRDAVDHAKAVLADAAADQQALDDALAALHEAVEALEKRPDDSFLFEDVQVEKAYYYAPVYWAYAHEPQITNGIDAEHFGPDNGCTRGQVVTFLWRAAGCPEPESTKVAFTDVKEGSFYYKAVAWAVENGITKGTTDTTFAPQATCTRGQIVTFLWRAAGSPEPKKAGTVFTDVPEKAFYAKAVAWAVENGITKGMTDTTFAPDLTCSRGQVVTFLYRAVGEK